jgi:glycerophosphoryl diester phosphodiesterase
MGSSGSLIVAGATGYGVWPANTLEGALACLAAPVDGIEIDVQITADGAVVAHHDYWLSPNSTRRDGEWIETRSAPIKTLTLAEVRAHDVGRLRPGSDYARRYPHLQGMDGVRIPTLSELLEALARAEGPRRLIYIEIKTDPSNPEASPAPEGVTEAVIAAVEAADWVSHAKIIAFDWRVLRLTKSRNPDLATAHLTIPLSLMGGIRRLENGDSPWADGCDPRHFEGSDLAAIAAHGGMEWSPYFTDVMPERMEEARRFGLRVGPWGLSASEDIQRMVALGVFSATVSGPAWA